MKFKHLFYLLVALTPFTGTAVAGDTGFRIRIGSGPTIPRDSWDSGWDNGWRSGWRSGWANDRRGDWNDTWGYPGRRFETRRHAGFEITTPAPTYRYDPFYDYDRWHDPFPEDYRWDSTHWRSGDTRFEYRAEPRRPAPPPLREYNGAIPLPAEPKAAPSIIKKKTPVVINEEEYGDEEEDDGNEATLRYCAKARGYYPAIKECPGGWEFQKGKKVR